jgi:hypothetical protein
VLQDHVLNGLVIDLKKVNPIVRRRRRRRRRKAVKKMDTMAANDLDHHVQKKMDHGKDV